MAIFRRQLLVLLTRVSVIIQKIGKVIAGPAGLDDSPFVKYFP